MILFFYIQRKIIGEIEYGTTVNISKCWTDEHPSPTKNLRYLHTIASTKNYIIIPETSFTESACVIYARKPSDNRIPSWLAELNYTSEVFVMEFSTKKYKIIKISVFHKIEFQYNQPNFCWLGITTAELFTILFLEFLIPDPVFLDQSEQEGYFCCFLSFKSNKTCSNWSINSYLIWKKLYGGHN